MLKKNDQITVDIERFGAECGIAHQEGMTLFVAGALPGEKVLARVQKVEKRYAFLKTLEVITPHPGRKVPPCPYYEKCGGCVCQHMEYSLSLQMKREKVQDALSRIGNLEVEVPPVLGMADPYHYRNKTALPVGENAGKLQIGFYAPRSHRIVDVDECLISKEESNIVLQAVRSWMEKFHILPYNEITHQGLIRHVMSRVAKSGDVMAVIIATSPSLPHSRELVAMLRAHLPQLKSVYLNVNKRGDNVILGTENHLLFGEERMQDTLLGLSFSVSPLSFFQVNPVQTEVLYQTALDFADLQGRELVADLYCGAGTISLLLAQRARQVIGIEIVPPAIEDAKKNAITNGIQNAAFHAAAAEELLPKMVAEGLRPDVVMLDPPRKGCEEKVLEAICQAGPEKIVYISCDVATQARDAKYLTAHGYRAIKCQSVDMFCLTGHVENVLLFVRQAREHSMKLRPAPFDMIKSGKKTIELRLWDEKRQGIRVGDTLQFTNTATGEMLKAKVLQLHRFENFEQLYAALPLLKCGYTEENAHAAHPSDMEAFYSAREQAAYGVVGIELSLL